MSEAETTSLCLKREHVLVLNENNAIMSQRRTTLVWNQNTVFISAWNELVLVLSSETRSRRTVLLFFVAETTRTSPFFLSSGNKNNVSMSETRTTPLYLKLNRRPSLCYVLIKQKHTSLCPPHLTHPVTAYWGEQGTEAKHYCLHRFELCLSLPFFLFFCICFSLLSFCVSWPWCRCLLFSDWAGRGRWGVRGVCHECAWLCCQSNYIRHTDRSQVTARPFSVFASGHSFLKCLVTKLLGIYLVT